MDGALLYKLIGEFRLQNKFAQYARKQIRDTLQSLDQEKTFFYVQAFMSGALHVSNMLWPEDPACEEAGQKIRESLKIPDDSPLNLSSKDEEWLLFDGRFIRWFDSLDEKDYLEMNIMPQGAIGGFKQDSSLRNLDPESLVFSFRDAACSLRKIADAMSAADREASRWLNVNHPW